MSEFPERARARVSVVIPVHNRPDQLARLLESLSRLDMPANEFDVIVCDDGSTEDLRPVIEQARRRDGLSIQYLRQQQRGPAVARNLGLKTAESEIVAFTDSDCEVAPSWLSALVDAFDEPRVGIAGGPVRPHSASPLVAQISNWMMSTLWGGGARDPRAVASMGYYPRAGNMAVRRDLACRCGGFPDTRYGEDVGFSHRVRSAGAQAVFAERAEVRHNERRTLAQVFTEAFKKGAARSRLWRSLGAIEFIHTIPALFVVYLLLAPLAAGLFPRCATVAALPAVAYLALLAVAACHSACCLRSAAAVALAPGCLFLLHVGYGLGLASRFCRDRLRPATAAAQPLDTAELVTGDASPDAATKYKTVA